MLKTKCATVSALYLATKSITNKSKHANKSGKMHELTIEMKIGHTLSMHDGDILIFMD